MPDMVAGLGVGISSAPKMQRPNGLFDDAKVGGASASTSKAKEAEPHSLRDEINEVGFRKFAEKIKEEKMEELRAQILEKMGISEDELANMSGEQRSNIEAVIARAILDRMEAMKAVKEKEAPQQKNNTEITKPEIYQAPVTNSLSANKDREKGGNPVIFSITV